MGGGVPEVELGDLWGPARRIGQVLIKTTQNLCVGPRRRTWDLDHRSFLSNQLLEEPRDQS